MGYGYGNVIRCLSGEYNKTILFFGQLYVLLELIVASLFACLLSFPCTYDKFISNSLAKQ